jgi:hypothetical protein
MTALEKQAWKTHPDDWYTIEWLIEQSDDSEEQESLRSIMANKYRMTEC